MSSSISYFVLLLFVFCLLAYHHFSPLLSPSCPAGASPFSSLRHFSLLRRILPFVFVIFYSQSSPLPFSSCPTSILCSSLVLIFKYSSSITVISFLLVHLSFLLMFLSTTHHYSLPSAFLTVLLLYLFYCPPRLSSYPFSKLTAPLGGLPMISRHSGDGFL